VLQCESALGSLDPSRGGVVREFTWHGLDVFRPTPSEAGDDPLEVACFPMVPYVNRVAGGHFDFMGRTVQLEPNWSGDPHPLHGQGWRSSWDVVSASDTTATLRFEGGGNEWPWRYRSEQCFELGPDELWVELSVENLSDTPMPAMLGLHPYFADATHARVTGGIAPYMADGCRRDSGGGGAYAVAAAASRNPEPSIRGARPLLFRMEGRCVAALAGSRGHDSCRAVQVPARIRSRGQGLFLHRAADRAARCARAQCR
jgi:hypothetical protein